MKKYCIIVAGGSGRRMKSSLPKQFLLLDGKPLLMLTIERFRSFDVNMEIIVVLPDEHISLWESLVTEHSFDVTHRVVPGGEERFHSVKAGLALVTDEALVATDDGVRPLVKDESLVATDDGVRPLVKDEALVATDDGVRPLVKDEALVAIHDGVRPLVSHDTIWRCFADAEEFGSAVPFVEPADSVRILDGDESRPLLRKEIRLIQTPQVFRSSVIIEAYERGFDPSFTDDATVAEAAGTKVHLTHGNRENIKITTPEDLAVANTLLKLLKQ